MFLSWFVWFGPCQTLNFNCDEPKANEQILLFFCYMVKSAIGQDEANPRALLARSGFLALVPQEKVLFLAIQ